ncbi:MAG: hypothetical protein C0171_02230 [Caldisphaera sp.]|nr:MAG: hypothetical protein C0171_02230 [Caldisphaera sp.]
MKRNLSEMVGSIIVITIVLVSATTLYSFYLNEIKESSQIIGTYQKRVFETYNPPLMSMIYNSSGLYLLVTSDYSLSLSYIVVILGNQGIIRTINSSIRYIVIPLVKDYNCTQNVTVSLITSYGAILTYNPYYDPNLNKTSINPSLNYFSCKFLINNTSLKKTYSQKYDILYNDSYFISFNPPKTKYYYINTTDQLNISVNGNINSNLNIIFNINGNQIDINNNGVVFLYYINDTKIDMYAGAYYSSQDCVIYLYFYSNDTAFYLINGLVKGYITFTASVFLMPIIANNAPILSLYGNINNYSGTLNYTNTLINGNNNQATYVGSGKISGYSITSGPLVFYYSNIGSSQSFNINISLKLEKIYKYNYEKSYFLLPYNNYIEYKLLFANESPSIAYSLYKAISAVHFQYPEVLFNTNLGNVSRVLNNNVQIFQAQYYNSYLVYFPYLIQYYNSIPGFTLKNVNELTYYLTLHPINVSPFILNPIIFANINNYLYFTSNDNYNPEVYYSKLNTNQSIIYKFIDGITYDTNCNQNIFFNLIKSNGEFLLENEYLFDRNFTANLNNGIYAYICFNNLTNDSINLAYFS